jgi:hypothetical protein
MGKSFQNWLKVIFVIPIWLQVFNGTRCGTEAELKADGCEDAYIVRHPVSSIEMTKVSI